MRWVEPKLVAEVDLRGWTADGLLRHASFKGLREDKDPDGGRAREPASEPGPGRVRTAREFRLTHPDRVLWPDVGLTKQGLAEFYAEIAEWILPHVVGRPLALVRCPSGVGQACFFQKHAWTGMSRAVRQQDRRRARRSCSSRISRACWRWCRRAAWRSTRGARRWMRSRSRTGSRSTSIRPRTCPGRR